MTLITGVGDEVTQFFIGLIVICIVSATVAWWSTNTPEPRHIQTVWLLDRRRHRLHRRLTNHTHAVTITEGSASTVQTPNPTLVTAEVKPSTSTSTDTSEERTEEDDRSRIMEAMDNGCVLRQRHEFYRGSDSGGESDSSETAQQNDTQTVESEPKEPPKEDITIKLKYINDELRSVDGKLKEPLGEFKKRHFQNELTTNKVVRLIFNGQVLLQDTKTLEGCGFFDNCVVHCLVHQRRNIPGEEQSSHNFRSEQAQPNLQSATNNNQGREWDLGNFLFAIISFTLLSAWYFRYVYAHLYTVTATVGLILMTGVFTIVVFGFYFPDQDAPRTENSRTQT